MSQNTQVDPEKFAGVPTIPMFDVEPTDAPPPPVKAGDKIEGDEQVRSLPNGTVLLGKALRGADGARNVWVVCEDSDGERDWYVAGDGDPLAVDILLRDAPLTVLWVGDAEGGAR